MSQITVNTCKRNHFLHRHHTQTNSANSAVTARRLNVYLVYVLVKDVVLFHLTRKQVQCLAAWQFGVSC